jgi:putative sigma-54 modulation protein
MGDLPSSRDERLRLEGAFGPSFPAAPTTTLRRPPRVQVSISTRHGHLSEASQAKIRSKAEKLGRYFDRLMSIELTIDLKDPQKPQVDVQVSAEHKHDFVAHEQGESLQGALDACIGKIEQQLRKYKERVQERHRNPDVRRPAEPAEVVPTDDEAADDAEE